MAEKPRTEDMNDSLVRQSSASLPFTRASELKNEQQQAVQQDFSIEQNESRISTGHRQPQSIVTEESRSSTKINANKKPICDIVLVFGIKSGDIFNGQTLQPRMFQILTSHPPCKDLGEEGDFLERLEFICFPDEQQSKQQQFQLGPGLKQVESFTDDFYQDTLSASSFERDFKLGDKDHSEDVIKLPDNLTKNTFFHFITTNAVAEQGYITSLTFKELVLIDQGAFLVPKAIVVVSKQPIFGFQRQFLTLLFTNVIQHNSELSLRAYRQFMQSVEGGSGFPSSFAHENEFAQHVQVFMSKWWSRNRNCVQTDKARSTQGEAAARSMLCSRPEFFISFFSHFLYFDSSVTRDIQIDGFGGGGTGQLRYRNRRANEFNLENFAFELLLQTLKPDSILMLVIALLLERKIVLIKDHVGDIGIIMQSLITLLSPFKWNFITITYLTSDLAEYLDAPLPYLIGISTQTWDQICLIKEYPEDIIIFDLESQERKINMKIDLPALPQPQGDQLLDTFKEIIYRKDKRIQKIIAQSSLSKQKCEEAFWADAELSVKQLFMNFLIETLHNYIQFFKPITVSPDSLAFRQLQISQIFDMDGYIQWQEERHHGTANFEFIKQLVSTQTFSMFVEQSQVLKLDKKTWFETAEGNFEASTEFYLQNQMKKLKVSQQALIDQENLNFMKPVRFKLGGIIDVYKKFLAQKLKQSERWLNNEQIEDMVMEIVFEKADGTRQLSLLDHFDKQLLLTHEEMPQQIQYDLVEAYWKRKYQSVAKRSKSPPNLPFGQMVATSRLSRKVPSDVNMRSQELGKAKPGDIVRRQTPVSMNSGFFQEPAQQQLFKKSRNSKKVTIQKKPPTNFFEGTQSTSSLHAAAQRISQTKKDEMVILRSSNKGASSAYQKNPSDNQVYKRIAFTKGPRQKSTTDNPSYERGSTKPADIPKGPTQHHQKKSSQMNPSTESNKQCPRAIQTHHHYMTASDQMKNEASPKISVQKPQRPPVQQSMKLKAYLGGKVEAAMKPTMNLTLQESMLMPLTNQSSIIKPSDMMPSSEPQKNMRQVVPVADQYSTPEPFSVELKKRPSSGLMTPGITSQEVSLCQTIQKRNVVGLDQAKLKKQLPPEMKNTQPFMPYPSSVSVTPPPAKPRQKQSEQKKNAMKQPQQAAVAHRFETKSPSANRLGDNGWFVYEFPVEDDFVEISQEKDDGFFNPQPQEDVVQEEVIQTKIRSITLQDFGKHDGSTPTTNGRQKGAPAKIKSEKRTTLSQLLTSNKNRRKSLAGPKSNNQYGLLKTPQHHPVQTKTVVLPTPTNPTPPTPILKEDQFLRSRHRTLTIPKMSSPQFMEDEDSKGGISGVIDESSKMFSDFLRNTFKRVSNELQTQTQPSVQFVTEKDESVTTLPFEDFLQNGISPPDMKQIYMNQVVSGENKPQIMVKTKQGAQKTPQRFMQKEPITMKAVSRVTDTPKMFSLLSNTQYRRQTTPGQPAAVYTDLSVQTPFKATKMQGHRLKIEKPVEGIGGFSKIATHMGDTDHNPSTPVSNNSSFTSGSEDLQGAVLSGTVAAMDGNFFRGGSMVGNEEATKFGPIRNISTRVKKRLQPKQKAKGHHLSISSANAYLAQPSEDILSPTSYPCQLSQAQESPRRQIEQRMNTSMHSRIFSEATVMQEGISRAPPGFSQATGFIEEKKFSNLNAQNNFPIKSTSAKEYGVGSQNLPSGLFKSKLALKKQKQDQQ